VKNSGDNEGQGEEEDNSEVEEDKMEEDNPNDAAAAVRN